MIGISGAVNGYSNAYAYNTYGNYKESAAFVPAGAKENPGSVSQAGGKEDGSVKRIFGSGKEEKIDGERCQTCEERKYQDGSNENVSFKFPAHVSPEAAASAVRAHEGEHVSNAYTSAAQKNGKVISASVSIHMSVCPECGRSYVSGGTTSTQIKYPANPYEQSQKALRAEEAKGRNIDYAA